MGVESLAALEKSIRNILAILGFLQGITLRKDSEVDLSEQDEARPLVSTQVDDSSLLEVSKPKMRLQPKNAAYGYISPLIALSLSLLSESGLFILFLGAFLGQDTWTFARDSCCIYLHRWGRHDNPRKLPMSLN
ncbi:hypothetical protein OROGR_026713 [Orobanche gracilis]